ncbi:MAG TPA: serine/threonine-protein kinase, partial [Gemmata sp.]|nr:serine/threonine-protein kinase [Gemmata sp.]
SRVLFPEQVEQLIRQPDIPQTNLHALCEYLLSRGVLTRFQAAAIREARGQELSFAGYPILDEIGPCPGGTAYKALHPSLRTPLILRRIRPDWLAPIDGPTNYIARARAFGTLEHPNIIHLLDAGVYHDELYAVIEQPSDAADLESLAVEVRGAMPAFLAAEYSRSIAAALRTAHERGATHGDVRPSNILVGPLTVKTAADGSIRRRPSPDAVVRLAELGLVPIRPAIATYQSALTPYLPPERIVAGIYDVRGDIYSLGATLYFLLTGRPPFFGNRANDLMNQIHTTEPAPLGALRPDLPVDLVQLVSRMMDKRIDQRPARAHEVEMALSQHCRPGTLPPPVVELPGAESTSEVALASPVTPVLVPVGDVPVEPSAMEDPWGVGSGMIANGHAGVALAPLQRQISTRDRARTRLLLILGAILHITAVALLIAWLSGVFSSSPSPDTGPDTTPHQKGHDESPQKKTRQRTSPG